MKKMSRMTQEKRCVGGARLRFSGDSEALIPEQSATDTFTIRMSAFKQKIRANISATSTCLANKNLKLLKNPSTRLRHHKFAIYQVLYFQITQKLFCKYFSAGIVCTQFFAP
jgi:hypothetical protein